MDETSAAFRPTANPAPFGVSPRTWRRFTHGVYSLVPILLIADGDHVQAQAGSERVVVERTFATVEGQQFVKLHLVPVDHNDAEPDVLQRPAAAYVQAMRPASRRAVIAGWMKDLAEQLRSANAQGARR